ncbi:MAG: hypothetical protein IPK85_03930 [Gemmatimonadetes bacterium]|nr:hypothetical protein [Gemmatimonadota bacterium]
MSETIDPVEEARRDIDRANLYTEGRGVLLLMEQMLKLRELYGGDGIHLSSAQVVALMHVIGTHTESHEGTAERYIACRETLQSIAELIPEDWEPRPWGHVTVTMPDDLVPQIKRLTEGP